MLSECELCAVMLMLTFICVAVSQALERSCERLAYRVTTTRAEKLHKKHVSYDCNATNKANDVKSAEWTQLNRIARTK